MERDNYLGVCPFTEDDCIFDLTDDTDCPECRVDYEYVGKFIECCEQEEYIHKNNPGRLGI